MKYIIVGIIIIILVIVSILFIFFRKKEIPITSIKHFRYHYTTGYAMNDDVTYELDDKKGYIVKIKQEGESEEETHQMKVTADFVQELEEILTKYHVGKWDGFRKIDHNVLDGNSFSISITFQDDTSIDASGYMSYPEHYRDVRKELDELFAKQLKN
jgi:preprotein translocase subunit SecF